MIQSTNRMGGEKEDAGRERHHAMRWGTLYRLRILMLPMPESILMFIRPALLE
jgi:hypothetical protein